MAAYRMKTEIYRDKNKRVTAAACERNNEHRGGLDQEIYPVSWGLELQSISQLAPEQDAQLTHVRPLARKTGRSLARFSHQETLGWKRFINSKCILPEKSATKSKD